MITAVPHNYYTKADSPKDCSLGNVLMVIAGVIGVATKNCYRFGFSPWPNQCYFVNPLPELGGNRFTSFNLNKNFKGFDIGFQGFAIPDGAVINGYFGSIEYWNHCESLVKFYLKMKDIAAPYEDTITIHYRNYNLQAWVALGESYYKEALKHFPDKPIVVITDNVEKARRTLKINCEYASNSPIVDFYLLSHSKYIIMGNSTFSGMAAYLSEAEIVVAPEKWYAGTFADCPKEQNYLCKSWIRV